MLSLFNLGSISLTSKVASERLSPFSINDDIKDPPIVIPGLTKLAPYLIRGNPASFWIPAPHFLEDKLRGNDVLC